MTKKYRSRFKSMVVYTDGESIYDSGGYIIEIDDLGGGEFIVIRENEGGSIQVNPDEWETLKHAIDTLIARCE